MLVFLDSYHESEPRDVPGRTYWISPFAEDKLQVDYSDEWEDDSARANGYYFEDTMPPTDIADTTAILDDGTYINGFIRTSGFDELAKRKNFVSSIKLAKQFQPLSIFSGWTLNLGGGVVETGVSQGNFVGFTAIRYYQYKNFATRGTTGYAEAPYASHFSIPNCHWFAAKIVIPIYDYDGTLLREDAVFYPIKKINDDTREIYRSYYRNYFSDPSATRRIAIGRALLEVTNISFNSESLADAPTVYEIVRNFCTAMGYSLRMDIGNAGTYWWYQYAYFSAYKIGTPADGHMSLLPTEVGQNARLIRTEGRLLGAQHNYVTMGGTRIWGISINDPLLPLEGDVATCDAVVFGDLSAGMELVVNPGNDGDYSTNTKYIGEYALASDLWPNRLESLLSAWKVTLQTNFFDCHAEKWKTYFEYENWLCAINEVARNGQKYTLSGVFCVQPNDVNDWPQIQLSQGTMTPRISGREWANVMHRGDGKIYWDCRFIYDPSNTPESVQQLVGNLIADYAAEGIDCELKIQTLNVLAFLIWAPAPVDQRYYVAETLISGYLLSISGLPDAWLSFVTMPGTRIVSAVTVTGEQCELELIDEFAAARNIIVNGTATPTTLTMELEDGTVTNLLAETPIDNFDGNNYGSFAFFRSWACPGVKLVIKMAGGTTAYVKFVLDAPVINR